MAITKIKSPELFDFSDLNTALQLPTGTTLERPAAPSTGEWRYNTTLKYVEYYDGAAWRQIDTESLPPVPSENFNVVLYAGNGGTQSITGVGFQPDFIWIKERNGTEWHNLFDSVRGADKSLYSNETSIEATSSTKLTSFDTDGFSLGSDNNVNKDNSSYVAWCFKGGGAEVSNTQGDIGSDVSANQNAGFSIVKYTGNNLYGQTVGHGLGVEPTLVIIKNRSNARNWRTYAEPLGATKYINLDEALAAGTYGSFNDTAPTIDVFSTTSSGAADRATNYPNDNYVAYCFANIANYQKVGSYTGNGSTSNIISTEITAGDGGFEPAFVIIKAVNSGDSWIMLDNKRLNGGFPYTNVLYPNLSNSELANVGGNGEYSINFLTNGFELTEITGGYNSNGEEFLYLAIAADPTSTTPSLTNSFKTNLHVGNGSYQTIGGNLGGAGVMVGNGSITLPSSTSFDGTSNLSFSLWVFRQNTNRTFIMDKGQGGSGSQGWQFDWSNAASGFVFQLHNTSNTVVDVRTGAIANNDQTWEHVVVTFNPSTFEAKIYYNGILCDSATHSGTVSSNTGAVTIGTYSLSTGFELTGSIDQFRFFNTVLTASQVSELYNETSSTANTLNFPTGAGCFAAYPFDSNANDLSGNHNASSETNITYYEGTSKNPSLVWIKSRSNATSHELHDSVRGEPSRISSDSTAAASTSLNGFVSLFNNGFTLDGAGGGGEVNTSGRTYAAWSWGASTLPTVNSAGTVTSIVSVNDAAGFSALKFAGASGANTCGHGLSTAPELFIMRSFDVSGGWGVYVNDLGADKYLLLESTTDKQTSTTAWNNTHPTSGPNGVLSWVGGIIAAGAGYNNIAYCFRSVSGYQKIGSYTWTGTSYTAGTLVTGLGFTPSFVMIKRHDGAAFWQMYDNKRVSGTQSYALNPNSADAESTSGYQGIIFDSDGFSAGAGADGNVTGTDAVNLNGASYIYLAIK